MGTNYRNRKVLETVREHKALTKRQEAKIRTAPDRIHTTRSGKQSTGSAYMQGFYCPNWSLFLKNRFQLLYMILTLIISSGFMFPMETKNL